MFGLVLFIFYEQVFIFRILPILPKKIVLNKKKEEEEETGMEEEEKELEKEKLKELY